MPLTEITSKTFTTQVGGPPEFIPTQTGGKTYVLLVASLWDLPVSETISIPISVKVAAGDASGRIVHEATLVGEGNGVGPAVWVSPPIPAVHQYEAYIFKPDGDPVELTYSLISLD